MVMIPEIKRIYRFSDFTLDANEHRLLQRNREIYLPPRTFETLLYLVNRHGHLVTKIELLETLWADSFVTENALTRCIKEVREALADDFHQPRYIRTVHRVGYKFIADVEEITPQSHDGEKEPDPGEVAAMMPSANKTPGDNAKVPERLTALAEPVHHQARARSSRRPLALTRLLASIVGVSLLGLGLMAYYSRTRHVTPPPQITSIAVLPFKPLAAAEARDESLELGMADTLITTLGNLSQITVRPISAVRKYTALDQDALKAGREQRVDAVLEGSIQKLHDRIRVTVRLVRVRDGVQLWADKFDQKSMDIFLIQDSISERVAETLAVRLTGQQKELLNKRYTSDTEAYQLYLRGRYLLNKSTEQDLRKSTAYFEQALAKDPNYALADTGLADSYIQLANYGLIQMKDSYPKAKAALNRALEKDEKLGEAHASLGFVLMNYYWNWTEAEREFKKAVEMNPNYAMAHNWYSQHLAFTGNSQEALREAKIAQEIDPISPWNNSAFVSFLARQYDEAILAAQKTLELEPNFAVSHMIIGLSYVQKKMYEEGISELQKASANPDSRALLGYAYAVAGKKTEARKVITALEQSATEKYVSPFPIAVAYTGLGEKDRAFAALEKAYEERSWGMGMLRVNPVFDPIRSDPRFVALLRRVNLPPEY
jgi:DNA-binding winged helix-turn-helix (wHTH) protein/TolB-like protein/Tfp pilus assembly protein PilF